MSLDPEDVVASFDSASVLHAATVAALEQRPFPHLGNPAPLASAARVGGRLPWPVLRRIYARIGGAEGIDPARLGDVDMQRVAASFADAYPSGRFPAVLVGSSNGALAHLAAAMQVPWLPGTVLIPVHHVGPADRPDRALEFGQRVGPRLLDANPGITLHQMHDAAQDELMVARMAYFRTKWSMLPEAYVLFLGDRLAPGAPVLLVDDTSRWPVTRVGTRHVFQAGGRGGLDPEQHLARPHTPPPDDEAPEAEWGADPSFTAAVEHWAASHGHPVVRITVDGPQEAAHPVAVAVRAWTRDRGGTGDRLIVPSFVLGDPWRTIELGRVPFWTYFPVRDAVASLEHHLTASEAYADVDLMLFQHGARSPGAVGPAAFARVVRAHGARPHLVGLRPEAVPHDIGAMARYGPALAKAPAAGIPFTPLPVAEAIARLRATVGARGRPIVQ